MKKFIIIAVIGLLGIGALFGSAEEDVPQETETVEETEAESEETEEAKHKQEEQEAKEKAEAERKAKEEREAKQKAEEEDRKQEEKKAKEEQERKAKEEEEAKQKAEEEEEAETQAKAEEAENGDAEELYYQIMQENLGMYVSVEFDEVNKIFNLTPIDQGLIDEISMLPMGIGHEDWGILVDGLSSMSKSGMDLVGEGYTINLVNPLNHDNIILWIIDGEIMYNVVDEL